MLESLQFLQRVACNNCTWNHSLTVSADTMRHVHVFSPFYIIFDGCIVDAFNEIHVLDIVMSQDMKMHQKWVMIARWLWLGNTVRNNECLTRTCNSDKRCSFKRCRTSPRHQTRLTWKDGFCTTICTWITC